MMLENHQVLQHTFFELYIDQAIIIYKKSIKKQLCHIFLEFYIDQK